MGIGDLVKKTADYVVQGVLVSYYFVYYLVKGHEPEEAANQNQLCIDGSKPMRPAFSSPVITSNANAANVCCVHGVQTKPASFGYPPPPPPIPKKPITGAQAQQNEPRKGWLSWLNPLNWFKSSKPEPKQEKPIAPPRHFKPSGHYETVPNGAPMDSGYSANDEKSWFSKAMDYLPSIGKKEETESDLQMPTRRILRVVATTTSSDGTQECTQTSLVQELKHAIEPHYPATLSPHDRSIDARSVPQAPPAPLQVRTGQAASIQIHVKPMPISSNVKPDDAWVTSPSAANGTSKQVIWTPNSVHAPQPHAASTHQVQMQRQQLRKTAQESTISPVPYDPEEGQKSVRDIKRQWPPPSNATGVEIVKDLVFPLGAPGDLSSAIMDDGEPAFNYNAYRPSSRAEISTRSTYEERNAREQSYGRELPEATPRPYERSATSPEKYRELSQELTSKGSAGKGVDLFVRRRQAAETWSPSEERPVPSSVQRMVPVAAPRKRISATEVADSVVEAATRKEHQWQPVSPKRVEPVPPIRTDMSPAPRRELERVASPTAAVPNWQRHERFFSPTPFNRTETGVQTPSRERLFTPPPRTHEPKVQQHAHRSVSVLGDRMEKKEFIDWSSGPETTTTVVKATLPQASRTMKTSTYTASRGSQYTKTSTYSLPRTWKSYSEAYKHPG